jgi:hypothetical protein
MHWLMGRKSCLSVVNKLLLYKVIIKPIWTYGLQLWGTASTSNIEILERFQSKVLRMITDAPWYVPNVVLRHDLHLCSVKEEISQRTSQYGERLCTHPNELTSHLMQASKRRRLQRHIPHDLSTRFKD